MHFNSYPVVFALMLVIISIMMPLQLNFGAEKARIAVIIIVGVVFLLGFGISKLIENSIINPMPLLNALSGLNILTIYFVVFAICVLTLILSLLISNKIMNKKEF